MAQKGFFQQLGIFKQIITIACYRRIQKSRDFEEKNTDR